VLNRKEKYYILGCDVKKKTTLHTSDPHKRTYIRDQEVTPTEAIAKRFAGVMSTLRMKKVSITIKPLQFFYRFFVSCYK